MIFTISQFGISKGRLKPLICLGAKTNEKKLNSNRIEPKGSFPLYNQYAVNMR